MAVDAVFEKRGAGVRLHEGRRELDQAGSFTVVTPAPSGSATRWTSSIGLDRTSMRGVSATGGPGVAVVRWSRERACVDAVEIAVRDERFEEVPGTFDMPGMVRKVIARFDGRGGNKAVLVWIGLGTEVRQRLACRGMAEER